MRLRKCQNCLKNDKIALLSSVGNHTVRLCKDCDKKIFNMCLGKSDQWINKEFFSLESKKVYSQIEVKN